MNKKMLYLARLLLLLASMSSMVSAASFWDTFGDDDDDGLSFLPSNENKSDNKPDKKDEKKENKPKTLADIFSEPLEEVKPSYSFLGKKDEGAETPEQKRAKAIEEKQKAYVHYMDKLVAGLKSIERGVSDAVFTPEFREKCLGYSSSGATLIAADGRIAESDPVFNAFFSKTLDPVRKSIVDLVAQIGALDTQLNAYLPGAQKKLKEKGVMLDKLSSKDVTVPTIQLDVDAPMSTYERRRRAAAQLDDHDGNDDTYQSTQKTGNRYAVDAEQGRIEQAANRMFTLLKEVADKLTLSFEDKKFKELVDKETKELERLKPAGYNKGGYIPPWRRSGGYTPPSYSSYSSRSPSYGSYGSGYGSGRSGYSSSGYGSSGSGYGSSGYGSSGSGYGSSGYGSSGSGFGSSGYGSSGSGFGSSGYGSGADFGSGVSEESSKDPEDSSKSNNKPDENKTNYTKERKEAHNEFDSAKRKILDIFKKYEKSKNWKAFSEEIASVNTYVEKMNSALAKLPATEQKTIEKTLYKDVYGAHVANILRTIPYAIEKPECEKALRSLVSEIETVDKAKQMLLVTVEAEIVATLLKDPIIAAGKKAFDDEQQVMLTKTVMDQATKDSGNKKMQAANRKIAAASSLYPGGLTTLKPFGDGSVSTEEDDNTDGKKALDLGDKEKKKEADKKEADKEEKIDPVTQAAMSEFKGIEATIINLLESWRSQVQQGVRQLNQEIIAGKGILPATEKLITAPLGNFARKIKDFQGLPAGPGVPAVYGLFTKAVDASRKFAQGPQDLKKLFMQVFAHVSYLLTFSSRSIAVIPNVLSAATSIAYAGLVQEFSTDVPTVTIHDLLSIACVNNDYVNAYVQILQCKKDLVDLKTKKPADIINSAKDVAKKMQDLVIAMTQTLTIEGAVSTKYPRTIMGTQAAQLASMAPAGPVQVAKDASDKAVNDIEAAEKIKSHADAIQALEALGLDNPPANSPLTGLQEKIKPFVGEVLEIVSEMFAGFPGNTGALEALFQ